MQSIEEKVRVDLHFQRFQLRLHQLRAQALCLQLSFAIAVVVIERVTHQYKDRVNAKLAIEIVENVLKHSEAGHLLPAPDVRTIDEVMHRTHRSNQQCPYYQMKQRSAQPVVSLDAKTPREPKHERRRKRPEVTDGHLQEQHLLERQALLHIGLH